MLQKRSTRCLGYFRRIWVWSVLCILSSAVSLIRAQAPSDGAARQDPDRLLTYMMENPLLREFFTTQFIGGTSDRDALHVDVVDRYVDMQIESFGKTVSRDLEELRSSSESVALLRKRWIEARRDPERKQAAAALAVMLRRLADRSDSLADLLQAVFPDLRRNKKLDLKVERTDAENGYLRQVTFLQEQVTKAEQLIRDYLFRPAQTIRVTDLSSENMLMRLDWVESIAKQVADRIL